MLIPQNKTKEILKEVHERHNHPGVVRTVLCFMQMYCSDLTQSELLLTVNPVIDNCGTCLLNKPNRQQDRGELGSLPTPDLANDLIYIDFVSMDPFNGYDYMLTCVDALTYFVQFFPCQKKLPGEGVIRILLDR